MLTQCCCTWDAARAGSTLEWQADTHLVEGDAVSEPIPTSQLPSPGKAFSPTPAATPRLCTEFHKGMQQHIACWAMTAVGGQGTWGYGPVLSSNLQSDSVATIVMIDKSTRQLQGSPKFVSSIP